MKRIIITCVSAFVLINLVAVNKVTPTKNVIVMIPDGTSLSVLSASRWLKTYRNEGTKLNIDPYLCGTVTTFCSNAPIGDSAPTTSCYMTGVAQQDGNVAIYPIADPKNDLVKLNPDSAYQPLITIPEAMKIFQHKALGMVVTCHFPHATPADCSAHTYNRDDYKIISSQMAYNNLDVMIGGGNKYITDDILQHFKNNGTTFIHSDKNALLNYSGKKVWALFEDKDIPYDIDRDTTRTPSLAQMTTKAIEVLKKNKNGFFLMVEGSKIDWAAHANNPAGILSESLAFDKAVGEVMEFARKDGNTTVIILPDHGNSGFSIGRKDLKNYTRASIDKLFGPISKVKKTPVEIEKKINSVPKDSIKKAFFDLTGIELTTDEELALQNTKSYDVENYMLAAGEQNRLNKIISIVNSRTYFGFTTGGHTGEEVFLAAYHPKGQIPTGNLRNTEINTYLYKVSGLKKTLSQLTSEIYSKHTDVFQGQNYLIDKTNPDFPKLIVKNNSNTLIVPAYSSVATLNGKIFEIGSVAVYVDKTDLFYLPFSLKNKLMNLK